MQNVIRNVVVGAGVLLLSLFIFFLVSDDQGLKQDVYNRALSLLGEQLLAVLPEDAPAAEVNEKWGHFSEQARRGEVPPEEVERIAVSILNASNRSQKLSPKEIEMMLELAMRAHVGETAPVSGAAMGKGGTEERGGTIPSPPPLPADVYKKLGQDLVTVLEFNSELQKNLEHIPQKKEILEKQFHYQFDNGLKIEIDPAVQRELLSQAMKEQFARLQAERVIEWRQNLARKLDEQRKDREMQLDSLRTQLERQTAQIHALSEEQRRVVLKSLDELHQLDAVDPEVIERAISESMKQLDQALQGSEPKP